MRYRVSPAVRCLLLFAAMSVLCTAPISTAGRSFEEFKEGIQALDRKEWQNAVRLLRLALEQNPSEDGRRVRIYGSRLERYYPNYYLGKALFHLRCYDHALAAFEESLQVGAIRGTHREDLLTLRDKCQERSHQGLGAADYSRCLGQGAEQGSLVTRRKEDDDV